MAGHGPGEHPPERGLFAAGAPVRGHALRADVACADDLLRLPGYRQHHPAGRRRELDAVLLVLAAPVAYLCESRCGTGDCTAALPATVEDRERGAARSRPDRFEYRRTLQRHL